MPNTEQIIKVLKNERECIKRQIGITAPDGSIGICDRICAECDLCLPDDEILEVYDYLIGLISIGVFQEHCGENEKPTKDLINKIAGFDVTLMPKLPEYYETEKPKSMAEDLHDFLMND